MKLSDIFNTIPNLTLFHEDHAINDSITIPDFNPRYAKIVGTFDGHDVWGTKFFGEGLVTFAFRNGEELVAFIVVDNQPQNGACPLIRTYCAEAHRKNGYIIALVLFVTRKLQTRLILLPSEKLTGDSWDWLQSTVAAGRIKATNGITNQPLTVDEIQLDRQQPAPTPLFVFLECTNNRDHVFGSGGYRQLNEMWCVIGDTRLN